MTRIFVFLIQLTAENGYTNKGVVPFLKSMFLPNY